MIGLPSETRVWLASGATDMRRGFDGLALLVQEVLKRDPHCGHLFMDLPARRIAELLPWNWKLPQQQQQRAAA